MNQRKRLHKPLEEHPKHVKTEKTHKQDGSLDHPPETTATMKWQQA